MDAFARDFVPASEVDAYQREIQSVRDQSAARVKAVEASAKQQIEQFRAGYPTTLQFDYELDRKAMAEPFLVSAIFQDDHFTYIKWTASEEPAIYEMKDGKPNVINFDLDNGRVWLRAVRRCLGSPEARGLVRRGGWTSDPASAGLRAHRA